MSDSKPLLDPIVSNSDSLADSPSQNINVVGEHRVQTRPLRYGSRCMCVCSNATMLILLWTFVLGLWNGTALNPDLYLKLATPSSLIITPFCTAVFLCFFPLASWVLGRY